MNKPTTPTQPRDFKYTPSKDTDVTQTWRRFGWTPPSEQRGVKS